MARWKPSKSKAKEFALKMKEIEDFCADKGITQSFSGDSYYFSVNGIQYRISNHSVEASNQSAFDELGNQKRALYHEDGRKEDTVYIHASKTRIIEIYNNLASGKRLDGKGNVIQG